MKMHCVLFILKKGLQSVQKVCIIIFVVEREISQSTKHNGRLAQLGEHLPYKQGVTGSIPVTSIMGLYANWINTPATNRVLQVRVLLGPLAT